MLLGFGLPVFMLPEKMEGEGKWVEYYNKVFDNSTFKDKVKPVINKALGGSLRLLQRKYTREVISIEMKVKWCFPFMLLCLMAVH